MTSSPFVLPLCLAVILSGCATEGTPEGNVRQNARQSAVKAGESAAINGCVGGALVGVLHTGSLGGAVKGCIIGGAVVGVATGLVRYQKQMQQWREFQEQEQAGGVVVVLQTATVVVHDHGQPQSTESPKSMTIRLVASDVQGHGAATQALLKRTASLADASSVAVAITVSGTKAERAWIFGQLQAAQRDKTTATIREASGHQPTLILTPAPVVGA